MGAFLPDLWGRSAWRANKWQWLRPLLRRNLAMCAIRAAIAKPSMPSAASNFRRKRRSLERCQLLLHHHLLRRQRHEQKRSARLWELRRLTHAKHSERRSGRKISGRWRKIIKQHPRQWQQRQQRQRRKLRQPHRGP